MKTKLQGVKRTNWARVTGFEPSGDTVRVE